MKLKNRAMPHPQNPALTRADIAQAVYQEIGLSKIEAYDLVNSVFKKMEHALVAGQPVKIPGFGTFKTRDKSERIGRNPKTGKLVVIPPLRVLSFTPSPKLNDRMNTPSLTVKSHDTI